jgi:S1-C subfamily serine protease
MRTVSFSALAAVLIFLSLGCNGGCTNGSNDRLGYKKFYGYHFINNESVEKDLIKHIAKRTVRITVSCKVVGPNNIVFDNYREVGWGSGAIVFSSKRYSLIQTANHVVSNNSSFFVVRRICDKFTIERRNVNNQLISTYRDKVDIYATDRANDIAILKVYKNFGVSSAIAKEIHIGQSIRTLGYPHLRGIKKSHLSYSKGYIATINMGKYSNLNNAPYQMRVAVSGYFGSSGGAIWNLHGEIIGIVTMLTGFPHEYGYIPQQDSIYGPTADALRSFYHRNNMDEVLED